MAVSCPNCKTPCVGCAGAKLAKASNGAAVCTKCIAGYELQLKAAKTTTPNAPSNVGVTYNPAKK